jgi:Protein of unknown function (DUF3987)
MITYSALFQINFKSRNAYRGGCGADEETELDQWTGSAMIVDRAERSVCIDRSSVCRLGGVQPDILAKLRGDHQDTNGAWSRWLFCAADAPLRYINLQTEEPDTQISETLTWLYRQLEQLPKRDYFLTTGAKYLFEAWQHQLVDTQQAEESAGLQAVYPKIEAYTARLALWLHIVNAVLRQESPPPTISEETMEQAIELAAYYLWQHRLIHLQHAPESGLTAIALKIQKFAERVGTVSASRIKSGIRELRKMATAQIRHIMQSLAQTGFGQVRGEGGAMTYVAGAIQPSATISIEVIDTIDLPMTETSIDGTQLQSETQSQDDGIDNPSASTSIPLEPEVSAPSFKRGDVVEVWFQSRWQIATYLRSLSHAVISRITEELDDGHHVALPNQMAPYPVATTDLRSSPQTT